jgi:hypothetical protein
MGNLVPVASREIGEPLGHEPLRALDKGLAIAEFMKSGDNAIATSATKSRRSSAIGASPKYLGGIGMRSIGVATLGVTTLLCAAPAQALTISNIDPKPHTVTVMAGSDSKELTIEAEKKADAPCSEGCKVKLENGDVYELKGGETVSIEDGVMYVDHSPDSDVKDIPDVDPDAASPQ